MLLTFYCAVIKLNGIVETIPFLLRVEFGMETKVTRNIQPNNKSPFSWLSKILKGIKTGLGAVGGVFKKFWKFLCKSKKFSICIR